MSSLYFWKTWTTPYRRIWFALSGVFIFSMLFMWYTYFQGTSGVIHWEKIQEQKTIETVVHDFKLGPFMLKIPGENYLIFEYFQGSDLHHNTTASYVFLLVLIVCVVVLLTVITTLQRFWYFAGMGLFIVFLVSLRLDVLLIFGIRGYTVPAIVLALFVGISFYFNSIRSHTDFITRLGVFAILTIALAIIIYMFSEIPLPILHLAVTAYSASLLLSVLFIIMVAHEILASFIYIANQGASRNLRHFSIISFIYLINVLLASLHEIGAIEWNIVYINLYLLLSLSAILGLWGFRLRENLYENIFSFSPMGAFFFVALGTICFMSIGQLLGNANDAALKVVRDIIIFTHTGFGIVFLMYVISNFMVMMADNLPVHKILYKPNRMPYFTFRLAGVIVTLAFVFVSHWRDYVYYSTAGFYNYVADLYMLQGNEKFAEAFYERSKSNAFHNNRANYALAMMKASHLDLEEAHENLLRANRKNPSDFSLVNDGNLYLWRKEYFPAIRAYREAEKIQSSLPLSNNLGFAYARIHNLDSATYYISEARTKNITASSAESNFFAMAAAESIPLQTDSILGIFQSESPAVLSNAIVMATLFNQKLKTNVDPFPTENLNLYTATLLNNYIIRNAKSLDTTFTKKALAIASDTLNSTFSEALKASLAYAFYHQGNVYKAQEILAELAYLTQSYQGKYNYIMGLWALDQGNPDVAEQYFVHAVVANYKEARLYNAIALTESGKLTPAMTAWDSVMKQGEKEKVMATRIKEILSLTPLQALTLGDEEKFQYARYVVSINDTVYFSRLSNSFANPNYKALALLDMSRKQFNADRIGPAIRIFTQTAGLELTDKKLHDAIRRFELRMLASRRETATLAQQINKGITFDASQALEKMLYTALISEASNDLVTARKNYQVLGTWNPYFVDGILAAAAFFKNRDKNDAKAYAILAEALQINATSIRLLKAYIAEAAHQGFDEYAASALQRLIELERRGR
jgi:hypothetical protein